MSGLIRKIFIGPRITDRKFKKTAFEQQCENLKRVWENTNETSIGLLRLFRLLLALSPFVFPSLYIRHISGMKGYLCRKMAVDAQVVIKVILPLVILLEGWSSNPFALGFTIYMLLETICYLFALIFISDIYVSPMSFKRSVLLLIINYIEVTLDFAVLYKGLDLLNKSIDSVKAIYFSFVTSTTLGYGDYYPDGPLGQFVVICQLLGIFVFLVLFLNYFTTNLNNEITYRNQRRKDSAK